MSTDLESLRVGLGVVWLEVMDNRQKSRAAKNGTGEGLRMREQKQQQRRTVKSSGGQALAALVYALYVALWISIADSAWAQMSSEAQLQSAQFKVPAPKTKKDLKTSKSKAAKPSNADDRYWDDELEDDELTLDERPIGASGSSGEISAKQSSSWRNRKGTELQYRFKSGFDSFVNEREQAQFFGFMAETKSRLQLLSQLWFDVEGAMEIQSGYAQSQFGDNVGNSGVFLREAALNFQPLAQESYRMTLSAGAISQAQLQMRSLIDRQPFPGVKAQLGFGPKNSEVKLWAQYAIPTSRTLSTRTVDVEAVPSFQSQTLELDIQSDPCLEGCRVNRLNLFATRWAYRDLPAQVAFQSSLYGNSLTNPNPTPNNSRFRYQFDGYGTGVSGDFRIARKLDLLAQSTLIQNLSAPEDRRTGQYSSMGVRVRLPEETVLEMAGSYYFTESDMAPAFYSSPQLGHMNREGYGATVRLDFLRQKFRLESTFFDAGLINPSPGFAQTRQQTLYVRFETLYEIL